MRLENGAWKLRVGAGAEPQRASDSEPRPGALNHPHIASAPAFPHTHTLSQCLDHRHTTDSFPAMASGGMSAARGMSALFRPGNMASAMRLRAGAGLPVGVMESPSSPVSSNSSPHAFLDDIGSGFRRMWYSEFLGLGSVFQVKDSLKEGSFRVSGGMHARNRVFILVDVDGIFGFTWIDVQLGFCDLVRYFWSV